MMIRLSVLLTLAAGPALAHLDSTAHVHASDAAMWIGALLVALAAGVWVLRR